MAMSDKKQDVTTTKGLSSAQKAACKKADDKMDAKGISRKADVKADTALAKKIKGKK